MVNCCKNEFDPYNFQLTYEEPMDFVISQWQPDKSSPSWIYWIFRVAIFTTFFVIWILSYTMETVEGKPRWGIYLTNWGMTLCVLQSFFSCVMLTATLFGDEKMVFACYKVYWALNSMATTVAFTITLVFWTIIYPATGYYWSTMNFMVHAFNSILMLCDLFLVSHPFHLLHFVYPLVITFIYTTMTAVYYACGGTAKGGSKYIYPILKWDEPGKTIGYVSIVMVLLMVIHSFAFLLYKLRVKIGDMLCGSSESLKSHYDIGTRV